MMTKELSTVLSAIPKNEENTPRMLCSRNGMLTYMDRIETLPSGIDLNTITRSGAYKLNLDCTNAPSVLNTLGAILQHWTWDSNRMFQEIRNIPGVFHRYYSAGQWSEWKMITATTVGGGNTLFVNALRNLAERRVA